MSKRSSVQLLLPSHILEELNRRLQTSFFSNYTQHTQWLNEQGYDVTRSAVHRYGQKLAKSANTKEEIELLNIFRRLEQEKRLHLLEFAKFQLVQKGKKAEIETRQVA